MWRVPKKLEMELPYTPAIPPQGLHYHRDAHSPTFIAALFVIARKWKQPTCLSADGWTMKTT